MIRSRKWILLIPAIVAILYGPSLHSPFVYDDRIHILENDQVMSFRSVFDPDSIEKLFGSGFGLSGRPLLFLTYGLNYSSAGPHPEQFRLTNLAAHSVNAMLLALLVLELEQPLGCALLAGALFAAQPLLTESVTYIAGRSSSLCGVFYFSGLLLGIRAGRLKGKLQAACLVAAGLCAALGWLVKQDAIVLPAALVGIVWVAWPAAVTTKRRAAITAVCITFLAVLLMVQSRSIEAVQATTRENEALVAAGLEKTIAFAPYVLTSLREWTAYYFWRLFIPLRLSVDPGVSIVTSGSNSGIWISVGLMLAIGIGALRIRLRNRAAAAALLFLVISPLSAYCLFPLADVIGEHRAYMTVAGAVMLIAIGLWRVPGAAWFSIAVLVFYGGLTISRNRIWSDEALLWQDAAEKAPAKIRPHLNLGALYQVRGQADRAIREYAYVLETAPGNSAALSNLASLYMDRNELDKTEALLSRAVVADSKFAAVYLNLGVVRLRQARFEEARSLFERARVLNPKQLMIHHNLGDIFFNENHPERAIQEYVSELQLNPNSAITHLNLAKAYEVTGARRESLDQYLIVRSLSPNNKEVQDAIRRMQ